MASLSWRQQLAHCARLGNALCCWRQDKLAIVRKFGRPDYFITITCGPNWSEFAAELLPGQAVNDRSDLSGPLPVPHAAFFCPDHQQGAGADVAAQGCLIPAACAHLEAAGSCLTLILPTYKSLRSLSPAATTLSYSLPWHSPLTGSSPQHGSAVTAPRTDQLRV